ncbi:MAG TPA: hypothetical protein VN811_06280 [Thermoanaerobaculia bacterium]|nr:hypothetical protein [Thermoanaerobaculia bacterium]HXT50630.1 hypothetical protein [Thermoanaerobaculia bacterium]
MRHSVLAAFALAVLSSALLAGACASSHPDSYTNVTAGTSGGKTVTGKVVSFTDSTVTIETTTGNEVIGITSETKGRDQLLVGANVAIDFQRSSGRGEPVATQIRPAGS